MLRTFKLFIAAALVLGVVAMGASAAEVVPGGPIESPSLGMLTFGSSPEIECNVTLNGSLEESVNTEAGAHIGEITEVTIDRESCVGGRVAGVSGLPWELTYVEALPEQGSLPRGVEALYFNLNNVHFHLSVFFGIVNCYYAGNAGAILETPSGDGEASNPYLTGLNIADSSVLLPSQPESSGACPEEGGMEGSFSIEQQSIYTP